jgi:hypothetical protein
VRSGAGDARGARGGIGADPAGDPGSARRLHPLPAGGCSEAAGSCSGSRFCSGFCFCFCCGTQRAE